MGKQKSSGQRRAEKVVARRKRARGGGAVCAARTRSAAGAPPEATSTASVQRAVDALDLLLEADSVDEVSSLIHGAVMATVARTLADRSPAAGELLADRLRDFDEDYAERVDVDDHCRCCDLYVDPDDGPSAWAERVLMRPLMAARHRWRSAPGLPDEVVAWVAAHLDRRGRSIEERAHHLGGTPAPRPDVGDGFAEWVREMVEHHEVAVLAWLVSGLVAVAGDGDIAWLEQLR